MSLSKAIGVISSINEFGNLFKLVRSAVSFMSSQLSGSEENKIKEDDVFKLQSDLRCLRDILPAMYNLIDRAEWRIHVPCVKQLLPNLKDAVYDAEDLLDEFRWYELKMNIKGNATQLSPFIDFFHDVTHGSFNKVLDILKRLSNLSSQLEKMGLHEATLRFEKAHRPVTTSFCIEPKIFGRKKELEEVVRLLGVPNYSSRFSSKRKRSSNAANKKPRIAYVPVLPIVGIGGVGKTTLVQHITTLPRVESHFDKIIWICVSDEFDVERFTKVLIKSLSGKEATTNNLDDLQQDLVEGVGRKRFLLILDDIWPNALKEGEQHWRKFCAPLTNVLQGSMLLVTTRFAEVADLVGTMDSFALEGLKDDVFWNFFMLCVFGSEDPDIDPQLEPIARSILPKLKGSPLAAKTIGRLLQKSRNTAYWNDILNNELWQIEQKEADILPALRLSYMYLPFHLKRCFSFCAVYPKDYHFEKASLAEIWVAEGFVEPQGSIPLEHIGYQYFEELVNLSFFQNFRGGYVIHDLMHDMAQLVSKEECFIVKSASDVANVPQNVRHLSILASGDLKSADIVSLWKHTKLHTLLCNDPLWSITLTSVIDCWFTELKCLRVIRCPSMNTLPESVGNQKHLRYLEISGFGFFKSLPSSFHKLYNLKILYARECYFEELPRGFKKLINLQKFESKFPDGVSIDAAKWGEKIELINDFNQSTRYLTIYNLGAISKDHAAEAKLKKKININSLTLGWSSLICPEHNETDVFQALHPPTNIKSVYLNGYPGEYLPSWFSHLNEVTVTNSNGRVSTIFRSLTKVSIEGCRKLSSLEQFLHPSYVPAIRKIVIVDCPSLKSIPFEWFEFFPSLEELRVYNCPNITHLLAPSLKKLILQSSGNLIDNISSSHTLRLSLSDLALINSVDCCSLTKLHLSCSKLASINLQKWRLPVLQDLKISHCQSLTFIGESEKSDDFFAGKFRLLTHLTIECCRKLETLDDLLTYECVPAIKSMTIRCCDLLLSVHKERFPLLTQLTIEFCDKLESLDLLTHEYVPAIKSITIKSCNLLFLPTERLGSFSCLKKLNITRCPRLHWRSGTVLPPSLQKLTLWGCGDFSSWSPSSLKNLTSLESLKMYSCHGIVSIPGNLWSSSLKSLKKLKIEGCLDLVSVGGQEAIANINSLYIADCPKLKEMEQTNRNWWYVCHFVGELKFMV